VPSAAILAGGAAARFGGRDKGGLLVGGRSILDRQLAELAGLTDDILLVGVRPGRERAVALGRPVRFVPDRVPDGGPLGGLDAALSAARYDPVVVLACDMPYVTGPLLGYLASLVLDHDAVVPLDESGWHPLCAVYARRCHAAVARRLGERRLAMRGLLDDLRVRIVSEKELARFGDPHRLLANVNTAGDLRRLGERSSG
jgi:molybdopterin-guanine dinucleotide biosynthesis protein A